MPVLPAGVRRPEPQKAGLRWRPTASLAGDIDDVFNGVDAARERGILKERDAKEVHNLLEEGLSAELPGLNFKGYEFHESGDLDKPIGTRSPPERKPTTRTLPVHCCCCGHA